MADPNEKLDRVGTSILELITEESETLTRGACAFYLVNVKKDLNFIFSKAFQNLVLKKKKKLLRNIRLEHVQCMLI